MTLPPRIKEKPTRPKPKIRFDAHRAWVREHACCVPGCDGRPIEAAHVRSGLPQGEQAGIGYKPADWWTISLCGGPAGHHAEQHRLGEASFQAKYGINMVSLAEEFADKSPKAVEMRRERWKLTGQTVRR